MTEGRIYVLHGRRGKVPSSNIELLKRYIAQSGITSEIAFLEGDVQTLEEAIASVQQRADQLVIIPVLLFSATHIRWDIPKRSAQVLDAKIGVETTQPLGTTEAVYGFLRDRIGAAVQEHPQRTVLLVAHGTPHFPEPFEQLQHIAARLEQDVGAPVVATNHIGQPRIEETLEGGSAPLIVQRLFLTDGRLAHKIQGRVEAIQPDSIFLPTLEDDPVITEAITERLGQLQQLRA